MTGAERVDAPMHAANLPAETCPLCGSSGARPRFQSTDRLYRTTEKLFQIVECSQCGLLRLSPQPTKAELAAYYPATYWFDPGQSAAGRFEETYRRTVLRDHVAFVAKALRSADGTGPVLDVGCGGGLFLGMLREQGFRVAGLDFSTGAAALAARRHRIPAIAGDLTAAPIAPESCTAITMFHVLEHVRQPKEYLAEARRLLRPGGRLIVQVPNAACWQFTLLGRRWNGVDAPRHMFLFRDRDLQKLLEATGFEIERKKYFSLRDNPAGLATSLAPWLDPMARRIRRRNEPVGARLLKDAVYFALVVAALPFTLAEAAFHAGSSIMIEARRRA
jgi:2-polyprenyl-3-methyl-5-hydroxy-6-metoxy-1,4-benzoquinol methylase